MKYILLACFVSTFAILASAQQPVNPFPRTITVAGSAEMEVIPDEINVAITIREYQKKGSDKKDLETLKSQFLENCRAVGIADSAISINSYTGYNNYYLLRKKKKDPDMMASITYLVKFNNSKTLDALVDKLDDEATQDFRIVSTSHSRITEMRRQLKIKAIQAAKDKGNYLAEAINEKLGVAVTVVEPDERSVIVPTPYDNIRIRGTNVVTSMGSYEVAQDMKADAIDFKKIKLRFEVNVVFALQ